MAAERGLQLALDLFEAEALMRQNLRRTFPEASVEEIERKVLEWLQDRPGAPHGDAPGIPRSWSDSE